MALAPGQGCFSSKARRLCSAFEQTLGSIRLDDSSAGPARPAPRDVPSTRRRRIALTLQTAGVGLNITNANKVIILEPFPPRPGRSRYARPRIGQLRPVEIIKFFCRNM